MLEDLSYEVHTGNELGLMRERRKPLSVFSKVVFEGDSGECEQGFSEFVQAGTFVTHEMFDLWDEPAIIHGKVAVGYRIRLYALKDEAWRIPAYLLLRKVSEKCRWNEALERQEGALLGYTETQVDEWLDRHYKKNAGWACFTVYALVEEHVLEGIIELGRRAFPKNFLQSAHLAIVNQVPARSVFEEAELLQNESQKIIRFGVTKDFFLDSLERLPLERGSLLSPLSQVGTRELNEALVTLIEIRE
ncbi:hypothetical protein [Microvirga flavescens]|uniref:hypothetical protein n=1 Tax=Microvirga flavescens TaxID=2249811 RepID=UPI000DD90CDE|nr:hypothetical protein [Microvirga flavescens]